MAADLQAAKEQKKSLSSLYSVVFCNLFLDPLYYSISIFVYSFLIEFHFIIFKWNFIFKIYFIEV